MKKLYVTVNYTGTGESGGTPPAFPFRVLDTDASVIAEGAANATIPAEITLPDAVKRAHVRLSWPSGKTETKRVDIKGSRAKVTFDEAAIKTDEWATWAVPRIEREPVRGQPEVMQAPISKFDNVWLRLWQFESGKWSESPVTSVSHNVGESAKQIDLQLDAAPYLLQIGGANVAWRFVALPGNGRCRVLLTPNNSIDPRSEPLKVVVTGFRADAENLMEFLSRDSLREAHTLAGFKPLAEELLSKKFRDPIAAAAGGYFLLRTNEWRKVPLKWFANLSEYFEWLPDAAVVHCAVKIRLGLKQRADVAEATRLLRLGLERGIPVFAEGLSLLHEAASLLRSVRRRSIDDAVFEKIHQLATSQAWAGAALSYYGVEPDKPSPSRHYGHALPKSRMYGKRNLAAAAVESALSGSLRRALDLLYLKDIE